MTGVRGNPSFNVSHDAFSLFAAVGHVLHDTVRIGFIHYRSAAGITDKTVGALAHTWRFPACVEITLPVAEKRKRFLQPLLVLSLGIFIILLVKCD